MSLFAPRSSLFFVFGAVALATVGCGPELSEESEFELGIAEQPISGGTTDEKDTNVVGILAQNLGALCTGSLIAPNMVLTARHCVSEIDTSGGVICDQTSFSPAADPSEYFVGFKTDLTTTPLSEFVAVKSVELLPSSFLCGHDIAVLILDKNVLPSVAKPLIPRVDQPLFKGEKYAAVGYGAVTDDKSDPDKESGVRRRRNELFVQCVKEPCFNVPFAENTEWFGQEGVCPGDSGGPALDALGRVIGVTSRGGAGCKRPIYGDAFAQNEFIIEKAKLAAMLGEYQPAAWVNGGPTHPDAAFPVGDACTTSNPATCPSGRCADDGVEQYCSRRCEEAAPCPEGFLCLPNHLGVSTCFKREPLPPETMDDAPADCSCSTLVGLSNPTPWSGAALALGLVALRFRRRSR